MLAARSLSLTRRLPVDFPFASYCSGSSRRTSARSWIIVKLGVDPLAPQHDAKGPVSASELAFTTSRARPRNFAPAICDGSVTMVSQYSHAPRISAGDASAVGGTADHRMGAA